MRLLIPVLLVVLWPAMHVAAELPHDETFQRVIDARRAIESGEVLVQSAVYTPTGATGELAPSRVTKYEIAFQGQKRRTVQMFSVAEGAVPKDGEPNMVSKVQALCTGDRIYRVINAGSPTNSIEAHFANSSDAANWDQFRWGIFDPRVFGLFPAPVKMMPAYSLEHFGDTIPRSTPVKEVDLDGVRVRYVSYQGGSQTHRFWISPTEGWNVVRSERIYSAGRRTISTCKIGQFDQIWFPREIVYEAFDATDKLLTRNVVKLSATFNRPIPADRFELSGMQIPDGTRVRNVAEPDSDGEYIQALR